MSTMRTSVGRTIARTRAVDGRSTGARWARVGRPCTWSSTSTGVPPVGCIAPGLPGGYAMR